MARRKAPKGEAALREWWLADRRATLDQVAALIAEARALDYREADRTLSRRDHPRRRAALINELAVKQEAYERLGASLAQARRALDAGELGSGPYAALWTLLKWGPKLAEKNALRGPARAQQQGARRKAEQADETWRTPARVIHAEIVREPKSRWQIPPQGRLARARWQNELAEEVSGRLKARGFEPPADLRTIKRLLFANRRPRRDFVITLSDVPPRSGSS